MNKMKRDDMLRNLYQNTKRMAKEKGIQMSELEESVGLSAGYLSRNRNCSVEKTMRIAEMLNTTMETLLAEPHTYYVTKMHDFFVKLAIETANGKLKWWWSHNGINCNINDEAILTIYEEKENCYCVHMTCNDQRERIYYSDGSEAIPYLDNAVSRLYDIVREVADSVQLNPYVRKLIDDFMGRKSE